MLTTALAVPCLLGYGSRQAYAACVNTGGTTYLCSGVETTTQTINVNNADVTMDTGATVDTSGGAGDAITITGDGNLSFTNLVGGTINGQAIGLNVIAGNGLAYGSITVNTTQSILGGSYGIYADNLGVGALTVNAASVTGTTQVGILGRTNNAASTGLSITATGAVSGQTFGIFARHFGTGALTINAASVTGTTLRGIDTRTNNAASTGLNITATGAVNGQTYGIFARHDGIGALTINAAAVTGTTQRGIYGRTINTASTGLNITATGAVSGQTYGIDANHSGIGALTINAAAVTGTTQRGIYGRTTNTASTGLSVTATGAVSGNSHGIYANHDGIGALTINAAAVTSTTAQGIVGRATNIASTGLSITATGAVSGNGFGIFAYHDGIGALTINAAAVTGTTARGISGRTFNAASTGLSVTATGAVSGNSFGIFARHFGTGALTINAAAVTGIAGPGIYARSDASGANITVSGAVAGATDGIGVRATGASVINVASSASVTGGTNAIDTSIGATGSADTVNNSGAVNGNILLGNGTNVFNNMVGATITGDLTTGTGNDTFANDGTFTGNANLGDGINVVTNTSHNSFTGDLTTGAGDDTVTNTGTWTGNVDLGGGTNVFNNSVGGIFNTLATVNVGAGNAFNNAGMVSPGGTGTIQTTTVTGNLVQTATGSFAVDVNDAAGTADRLNVSGTANLAGIVGVNLINFAGGQGSMTILSATGGTTDNGLTVTSGLAFVQSLTYPNATDVVLNYALDFSINALTGSQTPNQTAVGNNLNTVFAAGSGGMAAIITDLLGITDVAAYLAALDRLHGEHYLTQAGLLLGSNHAFVENLLSCPSTLDGAAVEMADDKCLWARVNGRAVNIDRSASNVGGDETNWGFSGGYEAPIREDLRAGFSFAVESSDIDGNNGASSDGVRFTAGAKVEKVFGALEASVGLYGGVASYDTTRVIGLGGAGVATSDHDIGFGSLVGRVSHTFETGNLRIVPMLDVAATYISYGGINETGAGASNLMIASSDEWVFSATPAIGIMGNIAETETYKINASLKGGVSLYSSSSISFSSRFAGAPAGTPSFTTTAGVDNVVGNLSGAIEIQFASNASVKLGYEGRIGNTTQSHGGFARAVLPF